MTIAVLFYHTSYSTILCRLYLWVIRITVPQNFPMRHAIHHAVEHGTVFMLRAIRPPLLKTTAQITRYCTQSKRATLSTLADLNFMCWVANNPLAVEVQTQQNNLTALLLIETSSRGPRHSSSG
jgi:hypothetical protein